MCEEIQRPEEGEKYFINFPMQHEILGDAASQSDITDIQISTATYSPFAVTLLLLFCLVAPLNRFLIREKFSQVPNDITSIAFLLLQLLN